MVVQITRNVNGQGGKNRDLDFQPVSLSVFQMIILLFFLTPVHLGGSYQFVTLLVFTR